MKTMFVLLAIQSVLIVVMVIFIGDQNVKIAALEREKLAQGWKTFTCSIMISENRKKICAK